MDSKLFTEQLLEQNERVIELLKEQKKYISANSIPDLLVTCLMIAAKMDNYMSNLKTYITDYAKTKEQYEAI